MKYLPLIVVLLIVFSFSLAVPLASAWNFDNVKEVKDNLGRAGYKDVEIKNTFGLGKTLWSGELVRNTAVCSSDCEAEKEITLYERGSLIEDIKFESLFGSNKNPINSYNFYVKIDGKWINYNLGDYLDAGTYSVKLNGNKSPTSAVDWIIKSQGKWIEEWAVWGSLPSTNIVAYWTLNETASAIDSSGSNTGTNNGATEIPGILASGYLLDGADTVTFGTPAALNFADAPMSISVWINLTDVSGTKGIISSVEDNGYQFLVNENKICFGKSGVDCGSDSDNISINQWTHVVVVYDPSNNLYFYINGTPDSGNPHSYVNTFSTGLNYGIGSRTAFVGELDELAIWNRTLTAAEVTAIYNNHLGTTYNDFSDGSIITLGYPIDNYTSSSFNVLFNCTATVSNDVSLANISFWNNESGTMTLNQTIPFFYGDSEQNIAPQVGSRAVYGTDEYGESINITTMNLTLMKIGVNLFRIDTGGVHVEHDLYVEVFASDSSGFPTGSALSTSGIINTTTISNLSYTWYNYTMSAYNLSNNTEYVITLRCPSCINDNRIHWGDGNLDNYSYGREVLTTGSNPWEVADAGDDFLFALYGTETNTTTQNFNVSFDGTMDWSCSACDNEGDCGFAIDNRTINLDNVGPVINITYPFNILNYGSIGKVTYINWTVSDTGLDSCWYQYYNGTNVTLTCGALNATFNLLSQSRQNISFFANDSVGNIGNFTRNWNYKIFENSETYNTSTVETSIEGFRINITANGSQTVTANLSYNGTSYTTTKTGNNSEMEFRYSFGSIPAITSATAINVSFFWEIYYGSQNINTTESNQSIERAVLGLCNATLTQPYINFTFEDEEAATTMNATIDSSTWTYYLGDGTVNKTLLYSNTTDVESYGFCFTPTYKTVKDVINLQYSLAGYPQRRWESTTSLTNTTNNQVLHLLSSADGTYSVYLVQTLVGGKLSGVAVTAERQFSGVWTVVEQGVTDDAGGITLWLNPDFDHRLTFTKLGYTTQVVTVRPSSSTYTVVMGSGAIDSASYNSSLSGLLWKVYPGPQLLNSNTNYTFGFNITANYSNIVSCKMELLNNNSISLGTTTGCNQYGGNLSIFLDTGMNRSIRGVFSVDVGDGLFIIDADAYWAILTANISERGTIISFFKYARTLDVFGSDDGRQEYTRIIGFFFFLMIVLGVLSKTTGWDFSTDGGLIVFVAIMVIGASVAGFFRLSYTGGFGPWIDKYTIALITGLFAFGFIMNKWARSMT